MTTSLSDPLSATMLFRQSTRMPLNKLFWALAALFLAWATAAAPAMAADLPSSDRTPGAVHDVGKEQICRPGYAHSVRHVEGSVKRRVYLEYGIQKHRPGEYEIDHLISLELGGSNDIENLWPQSFETEPWNAHVKDRLEDRLHALLCNGEIDLKEAQRAIAGDWIAAYKKYVGE